MTFRHPTLKKEMFFLARNRLFANLSYKDRGERLSYLLKCLSIGPGAYDLDASEFSYIVKKKAGVC